MLSVVPSEKEKKNFCKNSVSVRTVYRTKQSSFKSYPNLSGYFLNPKLCSFSCRKSTQRFILMQPIWCGEVEECAQTVPSSVSSSLMASMTFTLREAKCCLKFSSLSPPEVSSLWRDSCWSVSSLLPRDLTNRTGQKGSKREEQCKERR